MNIDAIKNTANEIVSRDDIITALREQNSRFRLALSDIAESEPIPTPELGWEFCRDVARIALG